MTPFTRRILSGTLGISSQYVVARYLNPFPPRGHLK